ncbi:MAG: cardiolipin synthase [Treponema sp.]|jgi:cardiolipin synthase|nr:cardiolipin synthase [Treponema sp.]
MEYPVSAKQWVRILFRQRLLVAGLLLVQIIFLIVLILGSSLSFQILSLVLNGVSIMVSFFILNRQEKPAYKLTWIFLILSVPLFGGALYIFFYFQSNSRSLRRRIMESQEDVRPWFGLPGNVLPGLEAGRVDWLPQVRYLQNYAGYPLYAHTQAEYYSGGESFFEALLKDLEKAETYIFMEFFILRQGKMLNPVLDIMARKAREGLEVRMIYDDMGCLLSLPLDFNHYLESRGIKCLVHSPFKPILSSQQNNRDHRKIISIDGKIAFTGGLNLADEYINAVDRFGHWKDSAIRIEGEAAWSLTLIFLQMWNMRRLQKDDFKALYPWRDQPCTVESDGYVQPYADSPVDAENVGEHVYIQIINNAKEYLYINTPYLVVDDNLLSALTLAAKSGVDVRIITPHRWDKWYVRIVSRSYYRQLIQAGVRVYEYSQGFNHSKTFVSDDRVATVGTTNLDFRSLYLHFECGVWVCKNRVVQAVKADFLQTLPRCHEISPADCSRNLVQRLFQDLLRVFAPLM